MRLSPKVRASISIMCILIVVSVVISATKGSKKSSSSTPKVEQAKVETTMAPVTPIPSQAPLTLEYQLTVIAKKTIDPKARVEFDNNDKLAMGIISDSDYTFLDETDMIKTAWRFFVNFGKEASKVEGVNEVGVSIKTTLVDNYGKESQGNAVAIYMKKAEFDKFNWESLRFMDITERLKQSADYFVQPSIWKKVKQDKLKLYF